MKIKEQLISEIDHLGNSDLELLFKIAQKFPHDNEKSINGNNAKHIVNLLQKIANKGGLGIADPRNWQREIRQDKKRVL